MSTITPPKVPISIGQVTIEGVTYQVKQDPEFVRFFFDLMRRIGGFQSWTLDDLQKGPESASKAELWALGTDVGSLRLASEIAQLRADVAEMSKTDVESQIAQLREQVAYMGMRRKRVVAGSIVMASGTSSATFAISPAVSSKDMCDLWNLGVTSLGGGSIDNKLVGIELTDTATITAYRQSATNDVTVYFQLTEFMQ